MKLNRNRMLRGFDDNAIHQSSIPVDDPGPEPCPNPPILIVGSRAIISARMSMTGFGTVLS